MDNLSFPRVGFRRIMPGCLCLFALFAFIGSVTAAEITAVWVPESGERAVFKTAGTGAALSEETQRVGRDFYDFCCRWIGSKNGYCLQNMRVETTDTCRVREYRQCADAHEIRITKAPGSSVYVGTLKYIERVYRSVDDAAGQVRPAAFAVAAETPVTELFMYIDGQWCY